MHRPQTMRDVFDPHYGSLRDGPVRVKIDHDQTDNDVMNGCCGCATLLFVVLFFFLLLGLVLKVFGVIE